MTFWPLAQGVEDEVCVKDSCSQFPTGNAGYPQGMDVQVKRDWNMHKGRVVKEISLGLSSSN